MKEVESLRQVQWYAIHNGNTATTEKTFASFTFQQGPPAPALACNGVGIVCWFTVFDLNNNGTISQTEFEICANALDTDSDGVISDNQSETVSTYQEKQGASR